MLPAPCVMIPSVPCDLSADNDRTGYRHKSYSLGEDMKTLRVLFLWNGANNPIWLSYCVVKWEVLFVFQFCICFCQGNFKTMLEILFLNLKCDTYISYIYVIHIYHICDIYKCIYTYTCAYISINILNLYT